jgi:hypothetical protein
MLSGCNGKDNSLNCHDSFFQNKQMKRYYGQLIFDKQPFCQPNAIFACLLTVAEKLPGSSN